jgi:hypothetical protein
MRKAAFPNWRTESWGLGRGFSVLRMGRAEQGRQSRWDEWNGEGAWCGQDVRLGVGLD